MMNGSDSRLEAIAAARWRMAISLTAAMMVVYVGFILLVAFSKPLTVAAEGRKFVHFERRLHVGTD